MANVLLTKNFYHILYNKKALISHAAAGSYRSYASPRRFENENRFQIIAGMREMSILFCGILRFLPDGIPSSIVSDGCLSANSTFA